MDDATFQSMIAKRELHGLLLAMSTSALEDVSRRDLWARCIIGFFATLSVLGAGFAWRNLEKTADLQLRLVRASEMNTHLRGMSVAAAGLAHEIRNPLNIIRGLAQIVAGQPAVGPEVCERSTQIVKETDTVAAQLNEFINYSRPREVRRTPLSLNSVIADVARTLQYDLEEKKVGLETRGDPLTIEADEQLLRQALFNLLINAVQAVDTGGRIQVLVNRQNASEATLEVRDDGPGVAPEYRTEVFKPYFTTQKKGTGLGLAVVQQIVLAHGWEIECRANPPRGAAFVITHILLAS
jgi:two-component system sensor histidine kinase HydH